MPEIRLQAFCWKFYRNVTDSDPIPAFMSIDISIADISASIFMLLVCK